MLKTCYIDTTAESTLYFHKFVYLRYYHRGTLLNKLFGIVSLFAIMNRPLKNILRYEF